MLTNVLIAAAAAAQAYGAGASSPAVSAPAPAVSAATAASGTTGVVPGRALRDLPNTTITYYDIAGKDAKAIDKSLRKTLADPAAKDLVRLFSWNVGTQIVKITTGTKCSVKSAKSTLTAKVSLPRLTEQKKVPKDVSAQWATYIAGIENEAAANLWFLSDRLRGAEQSLVGVPCAEASSAWNAKLEGLKGELSGFMAKRAQVAAAAAAAAAAAQPASKSSDPH